MNAFHEGSSTPRPLPWSRPRLRLGLISLMVLVLPGCGGCRETPEAVPPPGEEKAEAQPPPPAPEPRPPADEVAGTGTPAVTEPQPKAAPRAESDQRNDAAAGSPQRGRPAGKGDPTAAEALARAKGAYGLCRNRAAAGRTSDAYQAAVEGWEAVRGHMDNPACREIAEKLRGEIETLGATLTRENAGPSGRPLRNKTLISQ